MRSAPDFRQCRLRCARRDEGGQAGFTGVDRKCSVNQLPGGTEGDHRFAEYQEKAVVVAAADRGAGKRLQSSQDHGLLQRAARQMSSTDQKRWLDDSADNDLHDLRDHDPGKADRSGEPGPGGRKVRFRGAGEGSLDGIARAYASAARDFSSRRGRAAPERERGRRRPRGGRSRPRYRWAVSRLRRGSSGRASNRSSPGRAPLQ